MLQDLHNEFPRRRRKLRPQPSKMALPILTYLEMSPDRKIRQRANPALEAVLPPGYVQVGDEILPENEWKALLELNRRVKNEPETATRVRAAILGEKPLVEQASDPDALPVWLNPDDEQAVFMFRQQQRIDRELQEIKAQEAQRAQQAQLSAEETRKSQVIDAFQHRNEGVSGGTS